MRALIAAVVVSMATVALAHPGGNGREQSPAPASSGSAIAKGKERPVRDGGAGHDKGDKGEDAEEDAVPLSGGDPG